MYELPRPLAVRPYLPKEKTEPRECGMCEETTRNVSGYCTDCEALRVALGLPVNITFRRTAS
jgi:hypothetical protein